ncbi:MAG TPA: FAD:protein FMN transferase [Longimicrobiales bacterium]|nr:FAD:protein FMN transferase [Longimicrobiales bacterium]
MAALLVVPVRAGGSGAGQPARVEREAWAMGTRVRLVVEAEESHRAEAAAEAALTEIERVERLLSSWDATSELGRLNSAAVGAPVSLTAELAGLLGEAASWAERTGHAFDPTVGALIDAWDVRGEGRVPTDAELSAARAAIGARALVLEGGRAIRGSAAAWIDSGGFGKGAALRSVADLPEAAGVERVLVDLGGQLWASAPQGAPWTVEVAHPRKRMQPVARLAVRGVSVATSGASERPGHLLDPRSGRPVRAWGSVTVVSSDALAADALSTALYVMGPEAGLAWARVHGVAALFLETTREGLRAGWSEAMDAWLVDVSDASVDADTPGALEQDRTP